MAAYQYELLKCDGCGKTLGYIYVSVKHRSSPLTLRYGLLYDLELLRVEKTAFCEECFPKRGDEDSKRKSESKHEEGERVESRRDTRMVR